MSIAAGLDIEMPGAECNWLLRMLIPEDWELFGGLNAACTHLSSSKIKSAIDNDELVMTKLDDSVMRILTSLFAIGEFVSFRIMRVRNLHVQRGREHAQNVLV